MPEDRSEDRFDSNVDEAVQDVIEKFHWIGVPEDRMEDLMVDIGNAISSAMKPYLDPAATNAPKGPGG